MGEQSAKHLRGKHMEDVIFAGSSKREPNSLSSVELTFFTGINCPPQYASFKEISIGRKLYRTGESEYYINRQLVRRKDVTDLFLGTGVGTKAYSIIEQGRVGLVISAKPEERRGIIEEAAGISKFKARKEAALRRMEATRLYLSRLKDILAELERQMSTLERHAKKAERFRKFQDELKDLDLKLASLQYEKLNNGQEEILTQIKELDEKEVSLSAMLSEDETWVEEERLKIVEVETKVKDLQQDVYELDNSLKLAESKIHRKNEDRERYTQQIKKMDGQLSELKSELVGSRNGFKQVNEKYVLADIDCIELDSVVADQEGKSKALQQESEQLFKLLEESRNTFHETTKENSQISAKKESLEEKLKEVEVKKTSESEELESLTKKSKQIEKLLKQSSTELVDVKQLKFTLSEKTEDLQGELDKYKAVIGEEQSKLTEIKEKLLNKKSRLQSLEELEKNFEGYQEGPRQILRRKKEGNLEVFGSVAEILETNPQYENAVSAVLGEKMQYVVVKSQEEGMACAEYLKSVQGGRGSFVPIDVGSNEAYESSHADVGINISTENFIGEEAEDKENTTVEGLLGDLTQFVNLRPGFENLKKFLFGDVMLADSLSHALTVWAEKKQSVVTLDGEYLSSEGVLTGGTLENTSKSLLEKKREMKSLSKVISELVNQVQDKEVLCSDLKKKITAVETEIEEINESKHEEDVKFAQQEKDILHYQREADNLKQVRGKLSQQIFSATEQIEELKSQIELLSKSELRLSAEHDQAQSILEEKKSLEDQYKTEIAELQDKLMQDKIKLARAKEQKAYLAQEVDRLIAEEIRLNREIFSLEEQIALTTKKKIFAENRVLFQEKLIKKIIELKDDADKTYIHEKDHFENVSHKVREKEQSLKTLRSEYHETKDDLNKVTVELTEMRAKLAKYNEQILERYNLALSNIYRDYIDVPEEFDAQESEQRAYELRGKLTNIGNVNLSAIDELTELKERFNFLETQRHDLEESLDSLDRAINKINRTTKQRFKETFELMNDKFQKLFPRLFHGGHAYLELTDPDNILETGVDIIAQPPGKKLQSISLLSGGEKALTAVSLLFSIFLIKPAPFCLLDEVDAPLDDANVDRYNDIVKEMSQRTQFIVITHNKRTMQTTDALFGVTMQEPGVSTLVSVKMEN